jgi:hypothetical protein
MGIEAMIAKNCPETCVYWGNPVSDGEGGFEFDEPIEISCRWQDMQQLISDNNGEQVTSMALVYVTQDLDEQGMLYRGTLSDLETTYSPENSAGDMVNPRKIEGAYFIKKFEKIPSLKSTTEFIRKAYLTFRMSMGGF